jgi:anaerobic selenocysteine-containing dehydrogenase
MSFLLPHFLKSGRGRVDTYFTRVYNPVWTNPDGASWIEVLKDEQLVGLHAALTPVWSETAWFADYVLPIGTVAECHDLMGQETQAGSWIGFRQPVLRVVREKLGQPVRFTYEANPGEVWEEDEFWPVSGMHCWHQKIRVELAGPEDRYGDVFVDTNKSFQVYEQWLKTTRPAPGPDGLRRPLWFARAVRPSHEATA